MTTDEINAAPAASGLDSDKSRIRAARGKFAAMAAAYFLGVFNDNFFKQAACLIAITAGRVEFQGYLFAIYTVPFLIFAAPAGWAADRFSKRYVVIASKLLEIAAAVCGAIGICYTIWPLILAMVFIMGTQATFFSPAINGSIPELYPAAYVLKANSVLKVITTMAILIGTASAGEALGFHGDLRGIPLGHFAIAAAVVAVAILGFIVSLGVPRRPAAAPKSAFPWSGPVETIRALGRCRKDKLLNLAIYADAAVWFIGTLQIAVINCMGINQFHFDETRTGRLVFAELVGLAVGGGLAGKLASGQRWYRVLAPAGAAMGAVMLLMLAVPAVSGSTDVQFLVLLPLLAGTGAFGGLLLVPLESFIQVRPAAHEKGAIIAAANFAAFTAILLAGLLSVPLNGLLAGTVNFAVMGGAMIGASLCLWRVLKRGTWA